MQPLTYRFGALTGEVRKVDELPVFLVTSAFSLWAYLWLWIVFVAWTPDEITYAEAWITTLMFPLLVVVAYAADRGLFSFRSKGDEDVEAGDEGRDRVSVVGMERDGMHADRKQIAALMRGMNADEEDSGVEASKSTKLGQMANWIKQQASKTVKPMNRMTYRMNAVRGMFGRKHMAIGAHGHHSNQVHPDGAAAAPGLSTARKARMAADKVLATAATPAFSLKSATYSVLEKQGKVTLTVLRGGPLDTTVTVKYHTEDGTATVEDNDYTPVQGTLTFKPKEVSKDIEVRVHMACCHRRACAYTIQRSSQPCRQSTLC
jgi:solute carrier family 8 (sodium/calcium exchanger)